MAAVLLSPTASQAAPAVTTDKADYYSNEVVTVTGTGFAPSTSYDVPVIRPDGSIVLGDGSFLPGWDTVTSDASGNFTYLYQLNGIKGTYTVQVYNTPWGGTGSGQTPLATVTFTDADIDFTQCTNDSDNDDVRDNCSWTTGAINQNNSFYEEGDAVAQRLFHRVSNVGTYTFTLTYDFSKGPYAFDFLTNVDGTQSGALLNECADRPGFITASQCTAMFGTNSFLAPIPSDPFDGVSARENPPGAGARNFKVGCSPACNTSATVFFADPPPVGPADGEPGEAHDPDSDPDCFKDCGTSDAVIRISVTTLSSSTRIGLWFAGHLAEAADPIGSAIGWGTGCSGSITCGASSISGSPFHIKYTCLQEPSLSTCDSVGNRDNQIQIGAVAPPGIIQIIKDAVPDSAQDFGFSGDLGGFNLDDDADGTLSNTETFIDLVPGSYSVTEASVPGWALGSISCSDPDNGTTVNLGGATATIDLDAAETVTCTYTNNEMPIDVEKISTVVKAADCTSAAPATITVSQSTNICLVSQLRYNSGTPASVTVTDTLTHSPPVDCTSTSSPIPNQTLPKGSIVTVNTTVSIHCFQPSNHAFNWQNCIAITPPPSPAETNTANNCANASLTVAATATSDVKVNSVAVSSPGSNAINSAFNVTASASVHNNGPYGPVNADTTLTLALPGDCTTSSTNPQTVQNTSLSTSVTAAVPGSPASWSVTCTAPSAHQFSVAASVTVDQLHVSDPTSGNNSTAGNSTTSMTATSDIKVNSVSASAPASAAAGSPFNVTATANLHNNGSYGPTSVDTAFSLTLPADCSTSSGNPQTVQDTSLGQSVATNVGAPVTWSVTCTSPSNHSFSVSASAAIDQLHVSDPNGANNSANGSFNTTITATSDLKVNSVTVSSPASNAAGSAFNVTASASVHNNGAYGPTSADTTFTLSMPGDCTTSSANPLTVQNTSLPTSVATTVPASPATWSVTCSSPSTHNFSATASIAADQLHVSDPNSGNDSGSGSTTTDISSTSDVKVTSVTVSSPASNAAGSPFNVTASATVHNNGPYGPTNVDTTFTLTLPGDCTTSSANPQTAQDTLLATSTATTVPGGPIAWSVTCTDPSNHSFSVTATGAIDQLHVADPAAGDNSASGSSTTGINTSTDVKTTSVAVTAPPSASAGSAFNVSATATLHNNGPIGPANADASLSISMPPDCTTSSGNPQTVQDTALPISTPTTTSSVTWSVTCTTPSSHQFSVTGMASIDQLHLSDSNGANDSASGTATTDVGSTADIKVTTVSVAAPASENAGTAFNVTVDATVHNNGPLTPANVDTTFDLTVPADCTRTPNTAQATQDSSLVASIAVNLSQTWSVTCSNPSSHSFTGSVTATEDMLHVSDPDTLNNSGSGNGSTAIQATSDVKVSSASVSAPPSAGAGASFNVTVSANIHNNGTVNPVNTDTTLDLTVPGDCTRTPGGPQTVQDTALAPSVAAPVSATWSVSCSSSSNHAFNGSAAVSIDQLHVSDPTPGNDNGSGSATTAILAQADLKVSAVTVTTPATSPAATAFNVSVAANLHNNGAGPVNADATLSLSVPADCTKTPNTTQAVDNTALATSTASPVSATWSVTCSSPSSHQFTGDASVAVDQLHVSDPTPTNNSGQGNATTAVTGTSDVKVSSVTVSSPASANTNTAFNVTITATLHNNGGVTPVNVDSTLSLSTPADCTKAPSGTQVQQDSSLVMSTAVPVTKTWSVTCTSHSNHDFSGSASVAIDQQHVSDSNGANNSGNGGPATTAVLATSELKVSSVTVSAPPTAQANMAFNVTVNSTMHNNGTFSPANTDLSVSLTAPGDCTKTPNTTQDQQDTSLVASTAVPVSFTWSVTCTAGGVHTFTGSSTVTLDEALHIQDPNTGNNQASNNGSTDLGGTATPTPSPTVLSATATPLPTPVPVGGIVGLIDEDGTQARSEISARGGESKLTLGAISAGMALVLAGAWVTRRRLFG